MIQCYSFLLELYFVLLRWPLWYVVDIAQDATCGYRRFQIVWLFLILMAVERHSFPEPRKIPKNWWHRISPGVQPVKLQREKLADQEEVPRKRQGVPVRGGMIKGAVNLRSPIRKGVGAENAVHHTEMS